MPLNPIIGRKLINMANAPAPAMPVVNLKTSFISRQTGDFILVNLNYFLHIIERNNNPSRKPSFASNRNFVKIVPFARKMFFLLKSIFRVTPQSYHFFSLTASISSQNHPFFSPPHPQKKNHRPPTPLAHSLRPNQPIRPQACTFSRLFSCKSVFFLRNLQIYHLAATVGRTGAQLSFFGAS